MSCMEFGSWKRQQDGEDSHLAGRGEDVVQTHFGTSHIYSLGYDFITYKMGKLDYKIFIITTKTTAIEVLCRDLLMNHAFVLSNSLQNKKASP